LLFGEDRCGARLDHEIANQSLMCRKVAEHPAPPWENIENRETGRGHGQTGRPVAAAAGFAMGKI
jgi:hypothetical protein